MNTFYIPEDNLDRLEKQLATLKKKCDSNNFKFEYHKIGSEFKTVKIDDEEVTIKYIVVQVEGTVKYEGWEFVATIDHSNKAGNIIRAFNTELAVPEKYKTCSPECEHCHKIRSRKDTYLIYNHETEEFKQVGKSCMQEYTNGLDAEHVAALVSCYAKMETMSWGSPSSGYRKYLNVREVLRYAFETVKHFGYEKAYYDEDSYYSNSKSRTTRDRVSDYMRYDAGMLRSEYKKVVQEEVEAVGFNANSDYALQTTEEAMAWIEDQDNPNNDYLRNLHILCLEEYVESRNFGILVSMPAAYNRYLENKEYEAKKAEQHKEELKSEYQGEEGSKLEINCTSFKCITTFDNIYGTTWLYRFTDEQGNVFTWFASNPIENEETVTVIKGTVKKHEEYRGVKQTIMTRCKVIGRKEQEPAPTAPQEDVFKVLDEVFYQ